MLENIINVRIISHPINWLIVFAVVLIWGFLLTVIRENGAAGCGCDNGVPD